MPMRRLVVVIILSGVFAGSARAATPEEVADLIVFLASPRASYVSGSSLTLHGGGEPPAFLSARAPERKD